MIYQNYHNHKHGSNIYTADSPCTIEDYAKRCKELGHSVLCSMEHGYQGMYFDTYRVAKKYDLKFVYGTEAYWVKDRLEKDNTNAHICILSKSDKGRKAINLALSEANMTGYYYKPRLDIELLMQLPSDDVFITSACLGFWQYEDIENIILQLHNKFKDNFMLEVQYQPCELQKKINNKILLMNKKYGINIIAGLDSHYIYETSKQDREEVLLARGIKYENEDEFYMDYPSYDIVHKRFKEQNVLSDEQIRIALDNTNRILDFDDYDNVDIFSNRIKLPTLYENLTQEQKNNKLKEIITQEWKIANKELTKEEIVKYKKEIRDEVKTIEETGMTDYFLIDYEIVKDAVQNGGQITPSGRGSGVSNYVNTLLGFSKIDRINAPVKMFPERFMSKSRILETKSLPDLDLNLGNPEVFYSSQKKIFGEYNSYPMIAYGTFKAKSAFKIYAKVKGLGFATADAISKDITKYEDELKYASEDEKDTIDIYDYIDKKYHDIYNASTVYQGIVSDKKAHPCGYLIYDKDIREEIGLIRVKSESTGKDVIACLMDGDSAEYFKFLKNDLLKVDVVSFFYKISEKINQPIFTERELIRKCENNQKVWEIYSKGLTLGVNQVEKYSTTQKVMKYKPKNIAELCAFIAAIRPSFKSMYSIFENREYFEYGIPTFDKIVQGTGLDSSFMLYQETIMAVLSYVGFPSDKTYDIIKSISKKRVEKIMKIKDQFINNFKSKIIENDNMSEDQADNASKKVWGIIENSSQYGFNASHSYSMAFDSLYCAYLKSHYPYEFYETLLEEYSKKGNKVKVSKLKKEMEDGFNIHVADIKFRQDNRTFKVDKKNNAINQTLVSIKYLNKKISNELYKLRKNQYDSFLELYKDIKEKTSANARQLEILIGLDYFSEFGKSKKLQHMVKIYNDFADRKEINKDKLDKLGISAEIIEKYSNVQTEKIYKELNIYGLIQELCSNMQDEDYNIKKKLFYEAEYLGYIKTKLHNIGESYKYVCDVEKKGKNYFVELHTLKNSEQQRIKVKNKDYAENPFQKHDIINVIEIIEDGKWKMSDEYKTEKNPQGWHQDKNDKEEILKKWRNVKE